MLRMISYPRRPKSGHFTCYLNRTYHVLLTRRLGNIAEFVPIVHLVRECRDPRDDKFLELALNGRADAIITGDADLLGMHPWRGIEILSPADYLKR